MAYRNVRVEGAEFEFVKILNIVRGQSLLIKGTYDPEIQTLIWDNEEQDNDFADFGIITTASAMPGVQQRNYRQVFKFFPGDKSCRGPRCIPGI